jgi:hypothetical protein
VQKSLLRRHRHRQVGTSDDDGLPELTVPVAERHLLPFEGGKIELISPDIGVDRSELARAGTRHALADGAHGNPSLIVERQHEAIGEALKPVLHLGGAPLLMRRMPTHGLQTCGAGHRPRVPSAIGKIRSEHFVFVRYDKHVVVGGALREDRHLLLDLLLP